MTYKPDPKEDPVHAPNVFPDFDLLQMGFKAKDFTEKDLTYYEWNLKLYPDLIIQVTISYITVGGKVYRDGSYVELGTGTNWIFLPHVKDYKMLKDVVNALKPKED